MKYIATKCKFVSIYDKSSDYRLYAMNTLLINTSDSSEQINYRLLLGHNLNDVKRFAREWVDPISLELKMKLEGFHYNIKYPPYYIKEVNGLCYRTEIYSVFCVVYRDENNRVCFPKFDNPFNKYERETKSGHFIKAEYINGDWSIPKVLPPVSCYKSEDINLNDLLK